MHAYLRNILKQNYNKKRSNYQKLFPAIRYIFFFSHAKKNKRMPLLSGLDRKQVFTNYINLYFAENNFHK